MLSRAQTRGRSKPTAVQAMPSTGVWIVLLVFMGLARQTISSPCLDTCQFKCPFTNPQLPQYQLSIDGSSISIAVRICLINNTMTIPSIGTLGPGYQQGTCSYLRRGWGGIDTSVARVLATPPLMKCYNPTTDLGVLQASNGNWTSWYAIPTCSDMEAIFRMGILDLIKCSSYDNSSALVMTYNPLLTFVQVNMNVVNYRWTNGEGSNIWNYTFSDTSLLAHTATHSVTKAPQNLDANSPFEFFITNVYFNLSSLLYIELTVSTSRSAALLDDTQWPRVFANNQNNTLFTVVEYKKRQVGGGDCAASTQVCTFNYGIVIDTRSISSTYLTGASLPLTAEWSVGCLDNSALCKNSLPPNQRVSILFNITMDLSVVNNSQDKAVEPVPPFVLGNVNSTTMSPFAETLNVTYASPISIAVFGSFPSDARVIVMEVLACTSVTTAPITAGCRKASPQTTTRLFGSDNQASLLPYSGNVVIGALNRGARTIPITFDLFGQGPEETFYLTVVLATKTQGQWTRSFSTRRVRLACPRCGLTPTSAKPTIGNQPQYAPVSATNDYIYAIIVVSISVFIALVIVVVVLIRAALERRRKRREEEEDAQARKGSA